VNEIGNWIRAGRDRLGISQGDLAAKVGTSQAYISQWETGKRTPSPVEMEKLKALLGEFNATSSTSAPSVSSAQPNQASLAFVTPVSSEEWAAAQERPRRGRPKASGTATPSPGAGNAVTNGARAAQQEAAPAPSFTGGTFSDKVSFIWSVADLLRGDYKQSEYGKVILPFTVLRRLDQVLADTRADVRATADKYASSPDAVRHQMLLRTSGHGFYNTSSLDFAGLLGDPTFVAANLTGYVAGFSPNARDIMEHFRFEAQVERLDKANLLYLVAQKFAAFDLHPDRVSNHEMGTIFEELIRKFAEASNETAGEHFTPREVIRLMVNLVFAEDDDALRLPGVVRTMYDPACGTGGMLSVAEEHLGSMNPEARLQVFGQELNDESYAICKADMLIKGQDADSIKQGNSFSEDGLPDLKADYLISNPPFGVDWTKAESVVRGEHEKRGFAGRFGPGLPRKNDGSLLFLLHMWSKRKPKDQGGSRLAIVFNGSPLFTGGAGSGESEIRKWVIENDWLEAIVALPDQMFYNTGILTYIWVLSNRKAVHRQGKVQLINGVARFQKMRKSLGDKRKELGEADIVHLTRLYHAFEQGDESRIFDNDDFGYQRITVLLPGKDKDSENVPLKEDVATYMAREVLPHVPGATVDPKGTRIGYEIPFTRHFYVYQPPRPLEVIEKEIRALEKEIQGMLGEVLD
jgi:type I restriction enzyme M protein